MMHKCAKTFVIYIFNFTLSRSEFCKTKTPKGGELDFKLVFHLNEEPVKRVRRIVQNNSEKLYIEMYKFSK